MNHVACCTTVPHDIHHSVLVGIWTFRIIIIMKYFDLGDYEMSGPRDPIDSIHLSFSVTYGIDLHMGFLCLTELRVMSGLVTIFAIGFDCTFFHAVTWDQTHIAGTVFVSQFCFLFMSHLSEFWASPQR